MFFYCLNQKFLKVPISFVHYITEPAKNSLFISAEISKSVKVKSLMVKMVKYGFQVSISLKVINHKKSC